MSTLCTSQEAFAAIGYLERCFGGYPLDGDQKRPYLRLFVNFAPIEVRDAIDRAVRLQPERRPWPSDIAAMIQTARAKARRERSVPTEGVPSGPAVTPPGAVGDRIAELRQALHADKEGENG
jgi:hypothetical protein